MDHEQPLPTSDDTQVVAGRAGLGPRFVLEHVGLLVAAGSVLLVAVRLLAVSGYSPITATAVLQTQGTSSVVVASLIEFWPVLALGTLGAILATRRHSAIGSLPAARMVLSVTAACWVVFLVPALFTVLVGVVYLVARLVGRLRRSDLGGRREARIGATAALAVATLFVAMGVAVNPTPWLPAERLDRDQTTPLVGYVLADAGSSILVMIHDDRRVVRLAGVEVRDRTLCRVRAGLLVQRLPDRWRTLAPPYGLLLGGGSTPDYPDCP